MYDETTKKSHHFLFWGTTNLLHFHRTSLLESSAQTLVNTVNTVGVMGKGLAKAFKSRHPEMFDEYKETCNRGELDPGSFWLWKGPDQWVLNFATKKHWRAPSRLEYVQDGLVEFRQRYEALGIREIAFPRLGCGNGGLDWNEVRPLMVEMLKDLPITVFIHDFEKVIGSPEHELPLMRALPPQSFEKFVNDLKQLFEHRDGQFEALLLPKSFRVMLGEGPEIRSVGNCEDILATEDDLFRIWSLLIDIPVSRYDLPETAGAHALKLMSILSDLPYARAVNMASRRGITSLAIEFIGEGETRPVPHDKVKAID